MKASKMGKRDDRRLLFIGAIAVILWASRLGAPARHWFARMLEREPIPVAAAPLANKMGRIRASLEPMVFGALSGRCQRAVKGIAVRCLYAPDPAGGAMPASLSRSDKRAHSITCQDDQRTLLENRVATTIRSRKSVPNPRVDLQQPDGSTKTQNSP